MEINGARSREAQPRRAGIGVDSLTLWDKATLRSILEMKF